MFLIDLSGRVKCLLFLPQVLSGNPWVPSPCKSNTYSDTQRRTFDFCLATFFGKLLILRGLGMRG